ncbi:MAG TPA: asparaginase [Gemmatimonadaceae bacterium]|nr:asparaginase [Gemmatimonadaceae bacterium]
MRQFDLDILVTRGSGIESRHRVHAAVVNAKGALVGSSREPGTVTMWRSCAKPFQVMPLLASGGFDEVGWGDDELALACASHGGEPEHVAIAESMLRDLGLEEGDLACGPHEPLSPRGARVIRDSGERPTRLHNNCSGKHAAMLARAHVAGWNLEGYERDEHPVQRGALDEVARWSGVPADQIIRAVDGCGVVVFGLPLEAMARAYAALGAAIARGEEIPTRVAHAIATRPFLFGGTDRFDSLMVEETEGRVISKVGAEGVHTVVVFDLGIAFAIKVEDGATRAQYPAVLRMLEYLGALPERMSPRLAEYGRTRIRNTRGEVVGELFPSGA